MCEHAFETASSSLRAPGKPLLVWVFLFLPFSLSPLNLCTFLSFSLSPRSPHLVSFLPMPDLPLGSFYIFLSYSHELHFYFFLSSSSMLHDCLIHSLNKYLWSVPWACWGYYEEHSVDVVTKEEDIQQGGRR